MSSTYYNNLWKEAINELLENIHEEFDPLDENLGEKGVTLHLFSWSTSARTRNGSGFMHISTSNTYTATASSKTATTKWCTRKRECCWRICSNRPCSASSSSSSTSYATTPALTPFVHSTSTWMNSCWRCECALHRSKCTSRAISSTIAMKISWSVIR